MLGAYAATLVWGLKLNDTKNVYRMMVVFIP